MAAAKIFVIGNVNGQLESAFAKLTALHSKNNFSLALVVGNLFGEEQDDDAVTKLLEGQIEVPVSTYFTVGTTALPPRIVEKIEKDEEICPNLQYLGKRSVTKTSDGVRIVALGGILDPEIVGGQSKEQYLPLHTLDDAKALKGANSADILLTTMWPSGVWNGSAVALPFDPASITGSDAIADLCAALKPRYHFSPSYSNFFYEREPFFHPLQEDAADAGVEKQYTRFISMASFGNTDKAKAMYAFTLQTGSTAPASSTPSPFVVRERKRRAPQDAAFSRFSNGHDHDRRPRHMRNKRQRMEPLAQDRCFLCLANAAADIKTVVLIGDSTYLATAKGPLSTSETFAEHGIDFPAHMMIVTTDHNPRVSRATMPGEDADNTFKEMVRFRDALQAMVSTKSKHKLGGVTWEINRAANIHAHWQFLPVSSDLIRKGLVEAAFRVEAENLKLPKLQVKEFGISDEVQGDYVRIWIWHEADGEGSEDGGRIVSKSLLMQFDENVRFDLQYPRKVMAKLMGLEKRIFWQDCVQDDDEEQKDAEAVRTAMKPWDFT